MIFKKKLVSAGKLTVNCSIKCLTNARGTSQAAINFSNACFHRKREKNQGIYCRNNWRFFERSLKIKCSYVYHIYWCLSAPARTYVNASAIPMKSMHCDTCTWITNHVISNTGRIVSNFPQSLDGHIELMEVSFWAARSFPLSLKCISTT